MQKIRVFLFFRYPGRGYWEEMGVPGSDAHSRAVQRHPASHGGPCLLLQPVGTPRRAPGGNGDCSTMKELLTGPSAHD